MAKAASINYITYNSLETCRKSPLKTNGDWCNSSRSLAAYFDLSPEELFPDDVIAVQCPVSEKRVSLYELLPLMAAADVPMLPEGEAAMEAADLREAVSRSLGRLTERQSEVVRLRFGLDGESEHTPEEVAQRIGTGVQNVYALLRIALNHMSERKSDFRDVTP
jgi:DNA-directed RNA polymerase specialized sigma24 family protein